MREESFKLPDGAITKDIIFWADEWNKIGNLAERIFDGWQVNGYGYEGISMFKICEGWPSHLTMKIHTEVVLMLAGKLGLNVE